MSSFDPTVEYYDTPSEISWRRSQPVVPTPVGQVSLDESLVQYRPTGFSLGQKKPTAGSEKGTTTGKGSIPRQTPGTPSHKCDIIVGAESATRSLGAEIRSIQRRDWEIGIRSYAGSSSSGFPSRLFEYPAEPHQRVPVSPRHYAISGSWVGYNDRLDPFSIREVPTTGPW
ncbi:hypothetical protein C8Q74DRAFT_1220876 [Fomes fomentarius]|nr:hypothetical protein C8Q74DRAFT_1220876 [Fomes fomentarius]